MELTGIDKTNRSYFEPLLFLNGADPEEIQILAGVIEGGSPVAAAALGVDESQKTGRIVSIYARPDMRRKKAGSMLMQALHTLSKEYGLTRMECFYTDGMAGLDPFLRAHGFMTYGKRRSESYRLGDLLVLERVRAVRQGKSPVPVLDLKSANLFQKKLLNETLVQEGYGPLPKDLDEELTMAAYDEDSGAVILCSVDEGEKPRVMIRLLASFTNSPIMMIGLMIEWLNKVEARFGQDAILSFYAVSPKISAFMGSLGTPKEGQQAFYGEKRL